MSYAKCCVPGCASDTTGSAITLHIFPNPKNDPERFRSWVMAIGGDILGLNDSFIYANRRVCHTHFEDKYRCRYNRLSSLAVPTKNMLGLSQIPKFSFTEPRNPLRNIENLIDTPSTSTDPMMNVEMDFDVNTSQHLELLQHAQEIQEPVNKDHDKNNIEVIKTSGDLESIQHLQEIPKATRNPMKRLRHGNKPVSMTEAEKAFHEKLLKITRKLSKCKSKCKRQAMELKAAKNIATNPNFVKVMETWSSAAKILMLLQIREAHKKDKGRRFKENEKIIALTILKQSPKGYRFLRKIFALPSPQILMKFLNKTSLRPGINENVFAQLKQKTAKMKINDKLCILLFDEMALKANLTYNERKDKIIGFVDDGENIQKKFADHAQVFMIRGLIKNYKQPVAYTFSSGATKGPELANQIKLVITNLQNAGFVVVATVCDQGANNRSAINFLINESRGRFLTKGVTPKDNIILINDKEIVPLYDPPHLLKGIRNNLLSKDLQHYIKGTEGLAKWQHISMLYKEDPGFEGIRLLPKLTENHVDPKKIGKMKVKFASQVFSATVASNIGYLAEKGILPVETKATAVLLLFFDRLFDSVNGSFGKKNLHAKPLLGPVTSQSPHHQIWADSIQQLKKMKFLSSSGKSECVPSLRNWAWTLEGIRVLIKKLKESYGITSVWMRHLNQDPLENFFGAIRSHGCRNTNPTPERFESAYATLLINNLASVHAPGANCEDDASIVLHQLIVAPNEKMQAEPLCVIHIEDYNIQLTPVEAKDKPFMLAPLKYVAGYFVKQAKQHISKSCTVCSAILKSDQEDEYIKYREFTNKNWLQNPSHIMVEFVSNIQDIVYFLLEKRISNCEMIKQYITTIATVIVNVHHFNCKTHQVQLRKYLINSVARFFLFNYCKDINRILYGKRKINDEISEIQKMAYNYHLKSIKRK